MSAMSSNKELKEQPILARTHWFCEEFSLLKTFWNLFWPTFYTGPRWFQAWFYHIANHWVIMTLTWRYFVFFMYVWNRMWSWWNLWKIVFDSLITVAQSPFGCRKWSPTRAASCRTHWGSGYQAVSLYHRLLHRGGILDSTKFFTCNNFDCDMMLWHGDFENLSDLDSRWFWYSWVQWLWCCWRIEWWRLMKIYSRSSWSY